MALSTGNNSIDSLVHSSWTATPGQGVTLTYSYLTRVPTQASIDDANGFQAMSSVERAAVVVALNAWAAVANITFLQTAGTGDLLMGTNNQGSTSSGYAYLPNGHGSTALYLNNAYFQNKTFEAGSFGLSVLIHELGHTLGLKHPGNYNSTGGEVEGPFLPAATDNLDYTQMSYEEGAGFQLNPRYGVTPMIYDIAAIQYLYGANMRYRTGSDTYAFAQNAAPQAIWDAGGVDTFDFSASSARTIINLNAGTFSETAPGYKNISIAYNVTIERAIAGSGGSTIYGNNAGNVIQGGRGADTIHLGTGNDTVTGGGGVDTVVFNKGFAGYALGGSKAALSVTGEGSDTLANISVLQFSDRTIDLSTYTAVHGGSAGADAFVAGAGNELFSGGGGLDSVRFASASSNYSVKASGTEFSATDLQGTGGTDLLSGVERLLFSDGQGIAFDFSGTAGQAFRLYQAAFNRTPDLAGLGFWMHWLDGGMDLREAARMFVGSEEMLTTYGQTSDQQFIVQLYANVLHREPDAPGLALYINAFANGGFTRADALVVFSESAENQAAIIGSISNGITYTIFS
ncbi:MAG: DUF4214 domain-containing protein [Duganella sp.]